MTIRTALRVFLGVAVAAPIACVTLQLVAGLLAAMGDDAGANVAKCVATACVALWPIALVGLLLTIAVDIARREED